MPTGSRKSSEPQVDHGQTSWLSWSSVRFFASIRKRARYGSLGLQFRQNAIAQSG